MFDEWINERRKEGINKWEIKANQMMWKEHMSEGRRIKFLTIMYVTYIYSFLNGKIIMCSVPTSWGYVRVRWVNFNKRQAFMVYLLCTRCCARNRVLPKINDFCLQGIHSGKINATNNNFWKAKLWSTGKRKEKEKHLYIYGIRKALREEVAMGNVKSMKHHPNAKEFYSN